MTIKRISRDDHVDGVLVNLGNVGIGTTSPSATLHVVAPNTSDIEVRFTGGNTQGIAIQNGTLWEYRVAADTGEIALNYYGYNNGTSYFRNTGIYNGKNATIAFFQGSTGNVGIGTTSPSSKLDIVSQNALQITGYQPFLTVRDNNSSNRGFRLQTASGDMLFATDATGGGTYSEKMRISSSGNVGIGTTSPNAPLTVAGHTRISYSGSYVGLLIANKGASASSSGVAFIDLANENEYPVASIWGEIRTDGGSSFGIHTSPAGSRTADRKLERMRVDYNGYVGIGTTIPESLLHIKGTTAWLDHIIDSSASSTGGSSINLRANQNSWVWSARSSANGTSNNGLSLYESLGNAIRMVVMPGGNVGIGTTSPGYQLDVIASANLAARFRSTPGNHCVVTIDTQDAVTYSPYLQFSRNGVGRFIIQAWQATDRLNIIDGDQNDGVYLAQNSTAWVSNSDARLKDVTGTITNALDKVNQLTGIMFTWKRDVGKPDAKTRVGLLAQDVQAAFPEAVDDDHPDIVTDAETGKLSGGIGVRYTELIPLLVNAIKELSARIATLEQRV